MATQTEISAYRDVIDNLSTVAFVQLKALLMSIDDPNPIKFRDALLSSYPELMAPYMGAASEVAAQWYTELRIRAGITSTFIPRPAPLPPTQQLDSIVRHSLSPLFGSADFIGSKILSLLAGSSQRLIANQGRNTIDQNAQKDVATVSWSRVARDGACDFCKMLAGRGAVYRSAAAAGAVIGRGVDVSAAFNEDGSRKAGGIGGGVRARGSREVGSDHYHDHCRCTVVPTFYSIEIVGGDKFLVPIN